ncbi:hypothetical protein GCM10027290_29030 [Micromonospora sonneratiae]|uniref:DUF58 domain-containing protein n=1 Tax=Micromonospora sonneratiae TaxID=1184706 RepID=A0ABW3Y8Y5_9ACTN
MRPTARGWTVLASGAALLALGLIGGYRELVVLGGVGLLAGCLAAAWVGWPARIAVDRTVQPDRVRRGESCQAIIEIHSAAGRTRLLHVTDFVRGPTGERPVPVPPIRVRGGIPTRTGYALPTDRRGVLTVGPVRVGRRDPLGLFDARRRVGATSRLVVRPHWHRLRGLPVGTTPSFDGLVDGARHGSIAFHSLRAYRPGDELRHVHWRTSAKVGELMVREHVDTALPRVVLLLDDRVEAYPPDLDAFEEAVEAAASVLVTTAGTELPVMLRPVSWRWLAEGTAAGLDLLAEVQPVTGADLAAAVHRLRRDQPADTLVVVTGPEADLAPAAALAAGDGSGTVLVAVLGRSSAGRVAPSGLTVVTAETAAEFVARWDRTVR